MCQTACPVLINTGDLMRRPLVEDQGRVAEAGWKSASKHWDAISRAGGIALTVADAVPAALPIAATAVGRAVLGAETVPKYSGDLPAGGRRRRVLEASDPAAVVFSSCTTTMFRSDGVAESLQRLCERAGFAIATADNLPSLCCGVAQIL